MGRTSRKRAIGAGPAESARKWPLWLRRYVLPSLVMALPVYFGSKLIQQLGGGALWFPPEWRKTVSLFGMLVGLAAFNYARFRYAHGGLGRAPKLSSTNLAKHAHHEARGQLRALRFYAWALAFLAGYVALRYACVYSWEPRAEWTEERGLDEHGTADLPSFIELEKQTSEPTPTKVERVLAAIGHGFGAAFAGLRQHSHAAGASPAPETDGRGNTPGLWRGSFLVPVPWFLSSATRADLDAIEREKQRDPILYCLDSNEEWLIDRLECGERLAMGLTTLAFLAAHLAVLVFACIGFGCTFSMPEEVITELSQVV